VTPTALAASVALVVGVLGVGSELRRPLLGQLSAPLGTRLAALLAAGTAGCALIVLALGHLFLLESWLPWALGGVGFGLLLYRRVEVAAEARATVAAIRGGVRRRPVLSVATLGVLALAGIAALGPA